MPKKSEPSFELKKIIWKIAVTVGKSNLTSIRNQIDYEIQRTHLAEYNGVEIFEDTPDVRTIKRIIEEDMNKLPREIIISELPQELWKLRNDYKSIKQLAEVRNQTYPQERASKVREQIEPLITKAQEEHLNEVRHYIEQWKDIIKTPYPDELEFPDNPLTPAIREIENNPLFNSVKEHLSSATLWTNYETWFDHINKYLSHLSHLQRKIREDKDFNSAVDIEDIAFVGLELPILRRLSDTIRDMPWGWAKHSFSRQKSKSVHEEDHKTEYSLYADEIFICDCRDPKAVVAIYQAISNRCRDSKDTKEIINIFRQCKELEANIQNTLQLILLRRDYIGTICKLCPSYHTEKS